MLIFIGTHKRAHARTQTQTTQDKYINNQATTNETKQKKKSQTF